MRTLLIGAMAATLVGCSCFHRREPAWKHARTSTAFGCFDRTAEGQPLEPKPTSFKTSSAKTKLKSTTVARAEKPSSAHARDGDVAMKTAKSTVIAAKVEPPASNQPRRGFTRSCHSQGEDHDRCEAEDPKSAEFGEMKRAVRKNTLGQSVDTICGRVKGKKASGEDTGDRPFLYLVKDDDAYVVVDGAAGLAAASAYRNICN